MLRLLADENFPGLAVNALRDKGHDIRWVRTDSPGSKDVDVLMRSVLEARIILTFDKDFGELVFHQGRSASAGIILFRISHLSPRHIADLAVKVMEQPLQWAGNFSVVDESRIRVTGLPSSS